MKKMLFRLMAPALAVFALAACTDSDDGSGAIVFPDGAPEVVFTPGGETSRTIAFIAPADWTAAPADGSWLRTAPGKGPAGEASLTVALLEETCSEDRETTVTITAGAATATFKVTQKASGTSGDAIVFPDGAPEIIFTPGGETSRTVAFSASADWTAAPADGSWLRTDPGKGPAGEASLTVALLEETCSEDRETTVTITAGSATAAFKVIQKAPAAAQSISISAPQKKIVVGQTMPLTLETEPAGAVAGQAQWSSSDEAVATVSAEGAVTAVAPGPVAITAEAGGLTARCDLEVTEAFTTDGEGRTYTFADLAGFQYSGVTGDMTTYTVGENIVISAGDVLKLDEGATVKIKDGAEIKILGSADFATLAPSTLQSYDAAGEPAPLYFTEGGGGTIKNVSLINYPIRFYGSEPLTIEDCTFSGITSETAALNLGGSGQVTVLRCNFIQNAYPAVSGGANMATPLVFKGNRLENNSKNARNRPQINVTVAGDGAVEITGNVITGPKENTTNGGIAVSNMLGIAGSNRVLIEGNEVSDCRYGITTNGAMDVRIIDNVLRDNKWDSNPMSGGSGVSIYNSAGGQKVYMSGNTITGHLWGITNIGSVASGKGPELNLGCLTEGDDYNPGGNVFRDNGNGGVLYDLYNNCPLPVSAQGNTWNAAVQDEESIEGVIFHRHDDPKLGEVTFMPPAR